MQGTVSDHPSARENDKDGRAASARTRDIVVLKDVRKSFGAQEVLKGIDMVFRRNETTCVVGGSGAGKTTLLRLVVALDRPTSGHIYIDGEDTVGMGERELNRVRQKFGMVYQYAALLDSINVLDNVAFPLVEHTRLSRREVRQRVVDKLGVLGLDETVLTKFPSELSGGMRKRVGLARALMLEAERVAVAEGRTLLTLDTAEEDGAARLYEALGYEFAGAIPDYALKPLGGLTATLIYFKRVG